MCQGNAFFMLCCVQTKGGTMTLETGSQPLLFAAIFCSTFSPRSLRQSKTAEWKWTSLRLLWPLALGALVLDLAPHRGEGGEEG